MAPFYENFLSEITPDALDQYPLHWQIIYQEAMKSHHIIFDQEDILRFRKIQLTTYKPQSIEIERLPSLAIGIYKAANIPEIKAYVKSIPFAQRELLFFFYLRALKIWRKSIANTLN